MHVSGEVACRCRPMPCAAGVSRAELPRSALRKSYRPCPASPCLFRMVRPCFLWNPVRLSPCCANSGLICRVRRPSWRSPRIGWRESHWWGQPAARDASRLRRLRSGVACAALSGPWRSGACEARRRAPSTGGMAGGAGHRAGPGPWGMGAAAHLVSAGRRSCRALGHALAARCRRGLSSRSGAQRLGRRGGAVTCCRCSGPWGLQGGCSAAVLARRRALRRVECGCVDIRCLRGRV